MSGAAMSRHPLFNWNRFGGYSVYSCIAVSLLLPALRCAPLLAQAANGQSPPGAPASSSDNERIANIEQRLNNLTAALSQTRQALEQSLLEVQRLRAELDALQPHASSVPAIPAPAATPNAPGNTAAASSSSSDDLKALHDQQDTLQAEIKQHEQIKVETASKYPLRVTGLVLFNAFSNAGVVDNAELPTLAFPRFPGSSHGSAGATMRQTLLGLDATGPQLWNARSSAEISVDFFGGLSSNTYGYSSPTGLLRLRQANASLDWEKATAQVGVTEALISPLSPTSYATLAVPALSASGNLWAWSPQIRVEQRISFSDQHRLALEAGLIYPESLGYSSTQLVSPIEASRRPGYEGRVSYRADGNSTGTPRPFVLGIGAYSGSQYYSSTTSIHSWAVTADWQIPLFKRLELTGEAYRGRALGGFGGGSYKDILTGVDTITGLTRSTGVDAVGGWSQMKLRISPTIEANAAFGLDDALSSNFDGLILSSSTNPLELNARNSSVFGNLIFRPRTYLIFSPEYRRIQSWLYTGPASVANIFTITVGYQF
jgi:regulator of replication initiation timing